MKNWKTTLLGALSKVALLCSLIAYNGDKLTIVPKDQQVDIIAYCLLVWFVCGLIKDVVTADASTMPELPGPDDPIYQTAKRRILPIIAICLLPVFALSGCITDPITGKRVLSPQSRAALSAGEDFLLQAAYGAAVYYLGGQFPSTNQLASAGLYGIADVVQAYVGQPIPQAIVAASAGNPLVGGAIAREVNPSVPVTQADANTLYIAAAKVATGK